MRPESPLKEMAATGEENTNEGLCEECGNRTRDLARKEQLAWEREDLLHGRERGLRERELMLEERRRLLGTREKEVERREVAASAALQTQTRDCSTSPTPTLANGHSPPPTAAYTEELERREQKLREDKETAEKEAELLAQREQNVQDLELLLRNREKVLAAQQEANRSRDNTAETREKVVQQREDGLQAEREVLKGREATLNERERVLAEREKLMVTQAQKIVAREMALVNRECTAREREKVLEELDRVNAQREKRLEQRERLMAERGKLADQRRRESGQSSGAGGGEDLSERERRLAEQEEKLKSKDKELKKKESMLLAWNQSLEEFAGPEQGMFCSLEAKPNAARGAVADDDITDLLNQGMESAKRSLYDQNGQPPRAGPSKEGSDWGARIREAQNGGGNSPASQTTSSSHDKNIDLFYDLLGSELPEPIAPRVTAALQVNPGGKSGEMASSVCDFLFGQSGDRSSSLSPRLEASPGEAREPPKDRGILAVGQRSSSCSNGMFRSRLTQPQQQQKKDGTSFNEFVALFKPPAPPGEASCDESSQRFSQTDASTVINSWFEQAKAATGHGARPTPAEATGGELAAGGGKAGSLPDLHRAATGPEGLKQQVRSRQRRWEALLDAAGAGDVAEAERVLREKLVPLDKRDSRGMSAFLLAVGGGHLELMRMLADHGAEISACDYEGASALHIAVRRGNREALQLLLQLGLDARVTDNAGRTALQLADELQRADLHRLLAQNGEPRRPVRAAPPAPTPAPAPVAPPNYTRMSLRSVRLKNR